MKSKWSGDLWGMSKSHAEPYATIPYLNRLPCDLCGGLYSFLTDIYHSVEKIFEFSRQNHIIFVVDFLIFRAKNHFWVALWFIQVEREGEFTTFFVKINNAFIVKMISLSCKKARLLVGYYLKCLQKWLNHGLGRSKVEHNWHSMKFIARMTTLSASEVKKEIKLRDQWTIKNEIDLWQMISIHCKWLCD